MGKFSLLTTLSLNAAGFEQGLNKAQRKSQFFKKELQANNQALIKSFGGLFAGIGAGVLTFKTFEGIMKSTDTTADAYEKTMQQVTSATDALFKSIASGDFSNLLDNLKDAIRLGGEYAEALDVIEDRKRSSQVLDAKTKYLVGQEMKVLNNVNATNEQRIAAADEIIKLEDLAAKKRVKNAQDELNAKVKYYAGIVKIDEATLKSMLENYEQYEDKINKVQELQEAKGKREANRVKQTVTGPGTAVTTGNQQEFNRWDNIVKGLEKETKNYSSTVLAFAKINGEQRQELVNTSVEYYNQLASFDEQTMGAEKRKQKLLKKEEDAITKNTEKVKKEKTEYEKLEQQIKAVNDEIQRRILLGQDVGDLPVRSAALQSRKSGIDDKTSQFTSIIKPDEDILKIVEDDFNKAQQYIYEQFDNMESPTVDVQLGEIPEDSFTGIMTQVAGLSDALSGLFEENSAEYKAFAITQALISTYLAAARSLGELGPIAGPIAAAAMVVSGLGMVAKIASFAQGGIIGGQSFEGDKVLARVNSGEMVLNKFQQARLFAIANGQSTSMPSEIKLRAEGKDLVGTIYNYNRITNSYR